MANNIVIERLRQVFATTFQIDPPSAEVDLVDNGILDSFQLVELLFQLEREFGLRIALDKLDLDDLRSLERISRVITADDVGAERGSTTGETSRVPAN